MSQQKIQRRLFIPDDDILQIGLAFQHFAQAVIALFFKDLMQRRFAQVAVDQQHLLVIFRKRQAQVGKDGRLSFILQRAGDQDGLPAMLFAPALHLDPQLFHIFDETEGSGKLRKEDGLLAVHPV